MSAQHRTSGKQPKGWRRIRLASLTFVGFGLIVASVAIVRYWSKKNFMPSVQLPPGYELAGVLRQSTNVPPAGWNTNLSCISPKPRPWWGLQSESKLLLLELAEKIHECRGQTLLRAPQLPRVDFLMKSLIECHQISAETYILAAELGNERNPTNGMITLSFVWGAPNQLRHANEWIAMIEQGICNGVFEREVHWNGPQPEGTLGGRSNLCALVRDQPGLVKIVPIQLLKAYVNAGLIKLPIPGDKEASVRN